MKKIPSLLNFLFWKTGKRKVLSITTAVLIILVLFLVHELTLPVQGKATKIDVPVKVLESSVPKTKLAPASTLTNTYFSLSLPEGFTIQPNNAKPYGLLFNQTLIATGDEGSLLVDIAVRNLPDGGLSQDPSYSQRSTNSTLYSLQTATESGETVEISTSLANDGVVIYWPHKAYEATLSVSTGLADTDSSDKVIEKATALKLLANWQWL